MTDINRLRNINCTSHTIEARDLLNSITADINHHAEMAMAKDEKMVQKLQFKLNSISNADIKSHQREQRKLKKRITELDKFFSTLYEDRCMEKITERNFSLMSQKYETEQFEIEQQLSSIETELTQKDEKDNGVRDFVELIKGFKGIKELTAPIVQSLIDKITVSQKAKDAAGDTVQRIKIYYKFVGTIG